MDAEKQVLQEVIVQEMEENDNNGYASSRPQSSAANTIIAVEVDDDNGTDSKPTNIATVGKKSNGSYESIPSRMEYDVVCDVRTAPDGKRFYAGDVVILREDKPLREWQPVIGTVMKPPQGSEMSRNDDQGSATEFHVHWDLTNRITISNGSDVALVDRSLCRGQKVVNNEGMIGLITNYETTATVQISGSNDIIDNISLLRLNPISQYVRGQEILYHGWVGAITGVKRNIWFKVDGGPHFYLEAFEKDGFTRADPYWGLGVACPGMRTRLASSVLKRAKYVTALPKFFSKFLPLHHFYSWAFSTIIRTEVVSLEVKWLQPDPSIPFSSDMHEASQHPPEDIIPTNDLVSVISIGVPSSETIGIGSVRKIRILPNDDVADYDTWLEAFKKRFVDEETTFKCQTKKAIHTASPLADLLTATEETPVRVLHRKNKITVEWENGAVEQVYSTDIVKVATITDDGEFPAGLTVSRLERIASAGAVYGIVMDSTELAKSRSRKVNVRWIVDGIDIGIREESVFDMKPHNEFSLYHRGTILFPRGSFAQRFKSAVVTDVNMPAGKMVVIRAVDNQQQEVYPHEVVALTKRCHWSFFTRKWTVDDTVPPPYQLQLEYDPANKFVDVHDQSFDVLVREDPNNPIGKDDMFTTLWDEPAFEVLGFAPKNHRYYDTSSPLGFGEGFAQIVMKEWEHLQNRENVTEGIWLRVYENRMDLLSVLMVGPSKTPYEDGLFLFDMQLLPDFPVSRPSIHFVSYTLEIHPLLSYDGNVCVSMIPWEFPDDEQPPTSYIINYLSKLQELLFTPVPYFASPQKKSEEGTDFGRLKSELYNQGVFVRILDSIWNMLQKPHTPWEKCIQNHFASALPEKLVTMEKWMNGEQSEPSEYDGNEDVPTIPQMQIPEGLRISLNKRIQAFQKLLKHVQCTLVEIHSVTDATADSESSSFETNSNTTTKIPIITTESNRRLTPINELTEPSSSSTFGNKMSNGSMSPHEDDGDDNDNRTNAISLDSLKNVKAKPQKVVVLAGIHGEQRTPRQENYELDSEQI